PAWHVEPAGTILLETGTGAPARLDPEGIVVTPEGHLLISSEGVGHEEPRLPPAIVEYSADGRFIRQLAVRPRYAPNPQGPIIRGVRSNSGFESLTASPDFSRLFTASELPLAQDGEAEPFAPGSRTRLLEYVRDGGSYRPAREFAYEIDALDRPAYPVRFAVNGLVELLALSGTEMLALERGYVESEDRSSSVNRIRLFRVSLEGASDISGRETLRGAAGIVPVRKTLVADLNALPGLSPSLRNLDNFEGLAWGPPGPDGVRPLVLVSDDNFNDRQVTAFLFLRP
ncbi:MAG: esterase-like activity of phytase family protein, partial [Vicinamibacterales bacterium]